MASPFDGLTIGRMVHVVLERGELNFPIHRPAIVTEVLEEGLIFCTVFLAVGDVENGCVSNVAAAVPPGNLLALPEVSYDGLARSNYSWHWPERA